MSSSVGRDLWKITEKERDELRTRIGVLFQDGASFGRLNIYDVSDELNQLPAHAGEPDPDGPRGLGPGPGPVFRVSGPQVVGCCRDARAMLQFCIDRC